MSRLRTRVTTTAMALALAMGLALLAPMAAVPAAAATPPTRPQNVDAIGGFGDVDIFWSPPTDDGGSPITSYVVVPYIDGVAQPSYTFAARGGRQGESIARPNGITYQFRVRAVNAAGPGPLSTSTKPVTTGRLAGAPTGVTARGGDQQATVSWTAPRADPETPITGYRIWPQANGNYVDPIDFGPDATTVVITGLRNGVDYSFWLSALNAVGEGPRSSFSNVVTPTAGATEPDPPASVTASKLGSGKLRVSWELPPDDGGSPVRAYRIYVYVGDGLRDTRTSDGTKRTLDIDSLNPRTAYTFRVDALNGIWWSELSAPSNPVRPSDLPNGPTGVTAVAGDGQATVSWTAPDDGGSPITAYRVIPLIDDAPQPSRLFESTATTQVVGGLANGTQYTFAVRALNANGTGYQSGPSNPVVPRSATTPDPAPYDSWEQLVDQVHRQLLGRASTAAERTQWLAPLQAGTATAGDLVASLRASSRHTTIVDPVTRLYQAYFLRIPDRDGLEYWIGQRVAGRSLVSISAFFARSSEFTTLYGSLTDREFVELIYENILGRPGEPAGVDYWTAEISSGRRSRGQVMLGFSESAEHKTAQAAAVTVSVLHILWLDRAPTAEELAAGVAALEGGQTVAAYAQTLLPDAAVLP